MGSLCLNRKLIYCALKFDNITAVTDGFTSVTQLMESRYFVQKSVISSQRGHKKDTSQ